MITFPCNIPIEKKMKERIYVYEGVTTVHRITKIFYDSNQIFFLELEVEINKNKKTFKMKIDKLNSDSGYLFDLADRFLEQYYPEVLYI